MHVTGCSVERNSQLQFVRWHALAVQPVYHEMALLSYLEVSSCGCGASARSAGWHTTTHALWFPHCPEFARLSSTVASKAQNLARVVLMPQS